VLRAARPDDVEVIVALEVAAFGASDEPGVRAHLADDQTIGDWAVVTAPNDTADGPERIISASALLAHRMALDGVAFAGGQIEYVATERPFRRRGLVRAQFAWHHRRAAERGDLALFIGGIPYLYRRFGYGYGLDYPAVRVPGDMRPLTGDKVRIRPASAADQGPIRVLDALRPTSGLRIERDDAAWLVTTDTCHANQWEQLWVAHRDEQVVGWFRTQRRPEDGRVYLPAAAVTDDEPPSTTRAMIAHARALAGSDALMVWDVADSRFSTHLDQLDELGPALRHDHAIYARIPDPRALLDALRPILSQRFATSRYATRDGELVLSFYDSAVTLDLEAGQVARVRSVPGIEDPYAVGGVGIAPDWFGALVFGRFGAIGLADRVDDVTLGRAGGLMDVLFPARPADVVGEF
jgi:hypothetical protein